MPQTISGDSKWVFELGVKEITARYVCWFVLMLNILAFKVNELSYK